jgi:hypothetical protein
MYRGILRDTRGECGEIPTLLSVFIDRWHAVERSARAFLRQREVVQPLVLGRGRPVQACLRHMPGQCKNARM